MFSERLLVDWKTLKALGYPKSRSQMYRDMESGDFPLPLKFGKHPSSRIAWRMKDILNYLASLTPNKKD